MHTPSHSSSRARGAVVVFAVASLLLTGCGSAVTTTPAATDAPGAVTVENCGSEVTVSGVPTAAVGMHPAQTELLLRLGLAEHLAGQAQATAATLPPDIAALAQGIPVIGGMMPPSREELLSVEPDFVYSPTTYEFSADQGFASIPQLTDAGAAVYVASGGCADRRMNGEVTDLFTDLADIGEIFGVQAQAAELIAENRAVLDEVARAISGVDKLRVAQVYYEGGTLQAIGAGIEYDILRLAGSDSVYTPDQDLFARFFAATITPESLAAEDPDAIVFSTWAPEHEAETRDYLRRTFPDMPAVRDDRVIAVSSADVFPGTLGNVAVVRQIAEQLYPAQFSR
ncbi:MULTISPECIES: ABC transporter substrate-binding protein [unclassified Microbacterium]|uniref:ABC transporter substrate-binding protein n=1 Tax=unclassified Microbacterium TaxID=2609290 RepID=UPI00301A075D